MLLPSSASNPANMMAQALTMYKSLVGNVSNDKLNGSTPTSVAAQIEGAASSGEAKDEIATATTKHESPATSTTNYPNKPVFSLQSPKKGD